MKGATKLANGLVHRDIAWKQSGNFAVQLSDTSAQNGQSRQSNSNSNSLSKPLQTTTVESKADKAVNASATRGAAAKKKKKNSKPTKPSSASELCQCGEPVSSSRPASQCLACEKVFHHDCFGLSHMKTNEFYICPQCTENQRNLLSHEEWWLDEVLGSDDPAIDVAKDSDYTELDAAADADDDEGEIADKLKKSKSIKAALPHVRKILSAAVKRAGRIALVGAPRCVWEPALPQGAAVCYVNYYEKTCTCLGFIHSGQQCSHLLAVEAWVLLNGGISDPPSSKSASKRGLTVCAYACAVVP